jgi:hypothetical protein
MKGLSHVCGAHASDNVMTGGKRNRRAMNCFEERDPSTGNSEKSVMK